MRKGEIAISVIIVIALGLLVLITMAILLGDAFRRVDDQTSSCQDTYRGVCTTRADCVSQGGQVVGGVSCGGDLTTNYDGGWQAISFPAGGATCCVIR